ncbi:tripartite tricarboxylate transporter substrate binding protein [Pigmentiphaga soli]|uniref:Tripartite tricarboxylate transporter substrate binding protein n=1 Tax=Pigmentiphaga soli TaxID=1007095 RepID=A0ABP8GMG9_9BURK
MSVRILHLLLCAMALLGCTAGARADTYPGKPIRIIVPLAAGGPTDVLARTIAQHLTEKWGQPVVVENRPGANTNIGTAAVAKSPADGYTLLLTVNNLTINPSLYQDIPFDSLKDFAPVSLFATSPLVLVVNPGVPARSVQELIALAKAQPGKLHFGSPGNGSPPHLAGEMFNTLAGVKMAHVPYSTITSAVTDLMGGQIEVMFPGSPIALPQAKAGKLRALATTGAKRTAAAPELPTVAEAGLPNFEVSLWYGLLAPANTPAAIVRKLHAEVARIVALPAVIQQWAVLGAEPVSTTPEEFAAYLKQDIAKWQKVVRDSGAKMD